MMITGDQIRAGRALLSWSQPRLAEQAGLSVPTIKRMEIHGPERSTAGNVEKVQAALETGVVFIERNGGGPGVRLRE